MIFLAFALAVQKPPVETEPYIWDTLCPKESASKPVRISFTHGTPPVERTVYIS